MLCAFRILTLI